VQNPSPKAFSPILGNRCAKLLHTLVTPTLKSRGLLAAITRRTGESIANQDTKSPITLRNQATRFGLWTHLLVISYYHGRLLREPKPCTYRIHTQPPSGSRKKKHRVHRASRVIAMAPIPHPSLHDLLPRLSAYTFNVASSLLRQIPHALPSTPQILKRQNSQGTAVIPSVYKIDGPQPAAVAGIVLGSVAGFLLLIILIFFLSGNTPSFTITGETEEIVRRDDRSRSNRRSRRSDRSERIEVGERNPRVRTTIVEETRRGDRRAPSIVSEMIVDDRRSSRPPPIRRVDGDDIVEVIEEGSSIGDMPPRRDSRRRRSSGYRSVDPNLFAGGDYSQVRVERSSSGRYS
jgi:hypothetical protein